MNIRRLIESKHPPAAMNINPNAMGNMPPKQQEELMKAIDTMQVRDRYVEIICSRFKGENPHGMEPIDMDMEAEYDENHRLVPYGPAV